MINKKNKKSNFLYEQTVRNEDIFCSLLYDNNNSTIRVIDFRGGNFQQKSAFLERALLNEGMRKIYTLIERDDMHGWQRSGYLREGSIPGYYKRSDAYIMGRVFEKSWDPVAITNKANERKDYILELKELATEYENIKTTGFKCLSIAAEEVPNILNAEFERLNQKNKKSTKGNSTKTRDQIEVNSKDDSPVFMQFSRAVEYFYFTSQNKRTKHLNLLGAEYQDCFGNAKLNVYFDKLKTKTEIAAVRAGINAFVTWLQEIGAVAIFTLVDADNVELNATFASCGFRNSGWLNKQLVTANGTKDQILWTQKLLI